MTENQKKLFSLVLAGVLTFIIVGVWFHFSKNSGSLLAGEKPEAKLSGISPIQVIKEEFSKAFSNFNSAGETDSSTTTVPIEKIESATTTIITATTTNI